MDSKVPVKNEPKIESSDSDSMMMTKAEFAKLMANAVSEALKAGITAGAVGLHAANAQAQDKSREALIREANRRLLRCPICALPQTACGGPYKKDKDGNEIIEKTPEGGPKYCPEENHVRAHVGPQDANLFRWFQGFWINGVRFLSSVPGHRIWIPKKSDILTDINKWEQNEKDLAQKRTAEGQGAGAVGPGGQVLSRGQQRAIGWR